MKASRFAAPALLGAAPLIFFYEICFSSKTYLLRDLYNWFYPWRVFAAGAFSRGEFPLWDPYSYAGTPFFANMQSGLLYPPNAAFWVLDFPAAMRLFIVAQFAMAAWFMYLLLRAQRCRPVSSLTGAIAYAYGGWMIVHIEFPNKLAAAAWLPLILLGLTRWWEGRTLRGLVIGAAATCCCVMAGYPQTTFTLLLGAGVVWCGAMVAAGSARGDPVKSASWVSTLLSMPAVAGLGALIAAIQIVPFVEALSLSSARQPFEPAQVLSLGLSPWHFLDLVYPHFFGLPGYSHYMGGSLLQFWLGHFYVGGMTLCLALVGLFSRRPGAGRCAALLLIAAIFCLGDRTPLAPFCVAWLPGFVHFKWMSTSTILIAFALCWLAALGLDRILDDIDVAESSRRLPGWIVSAAMTMTAAAVGAGLMAWWLPERFESLARSLVTRVAIPAQTGLISANLGPVRDDAVHLALLAGPLAVVWVAARRGRLKAAVFAALVPLAVFADLMLASVGINYAGDPALYRETPSNAETLASRPDPLFRLYVPDDTLGRDRGMYGSASPEDFRWAANAMLYDLNLPWRLFSASDGDPLWSSRWKRLHRLLEQEGNDDARGRLLALANVGVVLKAGAGGSVDITEVPAYLPRIYIAPGARRVAAADGDALAVMLSPEWDPAREVLVEQDFNGEMRTGSAEPIAHTVRNVVYTCNAVTFEVEASRRGYLVLGDANYPGWEATIDSVRTPVFTANYLFRGIDLPAGRHVVRFVYRPASVRWGAAGSVAGLVILASAGLLSRRTRAPSET